MIGLVSFNPCNFYVIFSWKAFVTITANLVSFCLQVHVNLMITEARMQAELLYALRAVNRYMT